MRAAGGICLFAGVRAMPWTISTSTSGAVHTVATWRSLRRCYAAVIVLVVGSTFTVIDAVDSGSTVAFLAGPLTVALGVMVVALVRDRVSTRHAAGAQIAYLMTLGASVVLNQPTGHLIPYASVVAMSAALIPGATPVALVVLDALALFGSWAFSGGESWRIAVIDSVVVLQNASVAYVVTVIAVLAARAADDQWIARSVAAWRLVAEHASTTERRRLSALVHDEVLHALAMLAKDTAAGLHEPVRAHLRRAVAVLRGDADAVDDLPALIRRTAAEVGLRPRLVASVGGEPPPAPIITAIGLAAAEAFRNAAAHSGCRDVDVDVSCSAQRVRVCVRDDGAGFTPGSEDRRRGIHGSIYQRLTDVGGSATIDSVAGRGTSVVLEWLAPAPAPTPTPTADAFEVVRRNAAQPIWWLLPPAAVSAVIVVGVLWPALRFPALDVGVVVATIVLSVVFTARVRDLVMSAATYWLTLVAIPVLVWLNVVAAGPGWETGYALVGMGALTPVVGIACLLGTPRQTVGIAFVAIASATIASQSSRAASLREQITCVSGPIYTALVAIALRRLINHLGTSAVADADDGNRLGQASAAEAIRAKVREANLSAMQATVLPHLARWARSGPPLPLPPDDRRLAASLEAAARDSLSVPGLLDGRCIELLSEVRARGADVELRCDVEDALPALREQVSGTLGQVLLHQHFHSLVVTVWAADPANRSLVLVCDAGDLRVPDGQRAVVERFGEFTRIELALT